MHFKEHTAEGAAYGAAAAAAPAIAPELADYAFKAIGSLPKEGAVSYLEQHGQGLLGLAAQHPEIMKVAARYGVEGTVVVLLGKALHSLGIFGK